MAQKDEDFDAVRKEVAAEIAAINAGKPNHEDLVRELAVTKLLLRYAETTAAYRSEAFSALEQSIQTARESVTLLETERQLNVASRTIIWSLVKQMWVRCVPLFHRLHRRLALER